MDLKNKIINLENYLKNENKVSIAFSGGIDSVFLAAEAVKVLGSKNVLAVIVNSELFTDEEFNNAQKTADMLDIPYITAYMHELNIKEIRENRSNTWYKSKELLYATIQRFAEEKGFSTVLDGMICDDLNDFRPGLKAKEEAGIISPLIENGFYKNDIRTAAKKDGIQIWDKVASCSLCSRFPYNTEITIAKVKQVIEGEKYLRSLGFATARVRNYGETARLEVLPKKINELVSLSDKISKFFKKLGFKYVSADLEGYQVGKMNRELTAKEKVSAIKD